MPAFATPHQIQKPERPGWRPGQRVENDYYPTPPQVVRALLTVERFDGSIWEPACGTGNISRVLDTYGYPIVSTDLYDYGYGEPGIDFLKTVVPRARHIITNPPYGRGLANQFVEHALRMTASTGGKVAMLLNLASLCHPSRTGWWREHAPARIYGVDECVCWDTQMFGPAPWLNNRHRYMWAVWEARRSGSTEFRWLSTRPPLPPRHFRSA